MQDIETRFRGFDFMYSWRGDEIFDVREYRYDDEWLPIVPDANLLAFLKAEVIEEYHDEAAVRLAQKLGLSSLDSRDWTEADRKIVRGHLC